MAAAVSLEGEGGSCLLRANDYGKLPLLYRTSCTAQAVSHKLYTLALPHKLHHTSCTALALPRF